MVVRVVLQRPTFLPATNLLSPPGLSDAPWGGETFSLSLARPLSLSLSLSVTHSLSELKKIQGPSVYQKKKIGPPKNMCLYASLRRY